MNDTTPEARTDRAERISSERLREFRNYWVADGHPIVGELLDEVERLYAEQDATEVEMQYRATGLRVTVGIAEEDVLAGGWDGWELEQRAGRFGPWEPVDVAKVVAR